MHGGDALVASAVRVQVRYDARACRIRTAKRPLVFRDRTPWVVAVGLPMHGWSYAFYGMVGAHFVDREAPPHLRAGAQALVTFLANGPAVLIGNCLASRVVEAHRIEGITDWEGVWIVPLVGYVVAFVVFLFFSGNRRRRREPGPAIERQ